MSFILPDSDSNARSIISDDELGLGNRQDLRGNGTIGKRRRIAA
jgi:hypothetical protein